MLVMFAANFLDDFADAILFFHKETGQIYKYEEADFSDTGINLEDLGLKALGRTPRGLI